MQVLHAHLYRLSFNFPLSTSLAHYDTPCHVAGFTSSFAQVCMGSISAIRLAHCDSSCPCRKVCRWQYSPGQVGLGSRLSTSVARHDTRAHVAGYAGQLHSLVQLEFECEQLNPPIWHAMTGHSNVPGSAGVTLKNRLIQVGLGSHF